MKWLAGRQLTSTRESAIGMVVRNIRSERKIRMRRPKFRQLVMVFHNVATGYREFSSVPGENCRKRRYRDTVERRFDLRCPQCGTIRRMNHYAERTFHW
jgi:hypothetical protein